ncbi:hypothetical protein DSO57_1014567 [Entomophthora muscae]|uniref:Uncharacterized protein n=1 Tax=Entomophthora muscae TaxID=34485 RepID=A0ACC2SU70_9FUNG|nr:hypothetical protein DSO57_1014567 [Entomophthora muscae]
MKILTSSDGLFPTAVDCYEDPPLLMVLTFQVDLYKYDAPQDGPLLQDPPVPV